MTISNGEPTDKSVEDRLSAALGLDDEDTPDPAPAEPDDTGSTTEDPGKTPDPVSDPAPEGEAEDEGAGDPPPDSAQDDSGNAPQLYTVKVKGVEHKVTLEELLAGHSRHKDYTQKTSELAEERRALAAEQDAVRQERALYAQTLDRLRQRAEMELEQEPDWDALRQSDPIEYGVQYAEYSRKRDKLTAMQAEQTRLAGIAQQERADSLKAHVAAEREKLFAALPGWTDAGVAQREGEAIREYGRQIGFTDAELDQTYDSRAVLALNKARLWDELQARKAKALPSGTARRPAPRPAPAGSAPRPKTQVAQKYDDRRSALRKSGKVDDAARALELILDD